jgi:hypothetical protein
MRAIAAAPGQVCLLAPYRAVESFHMRGVDLVADAQPLVRFITDSKLSFNLILMYSSPLSLAR